MRLARAERLSEFLADDQTPDILVQRMSMGETLEEICASRGVPYAIVAQWISRDVELSEACFAATRLYADKLVKEGTAAVDAAVDPDDVPVAKLKSDWRKWLAGQVNRERYGAKQDLNVAVGVKVEIVRFAGALAGDEGAVQPLPLTAGPDAQALIGGPVTPEKNKDMGDSLDAEAA